MKSWDRGRDSPEVKVHKNNGNRQGKKGPGIIGARISFDAPGVGKKMVRAQTALRSSPGFGTRCSPVVNIGKTVPATTRNGRDPGLWAH